MTNREICERLVKISSELLHVSLQWKLSTGYGRDHAKRAMELLEIAQALDPDLAAPDDHFADADKMVREEEGK